MHARYTLKEFAELWSERSKYERWLDIEIAHLSVLKDEKIIPYHEYEEFMKLIPEEIDINKIQEIESVCKHDVIAFVTYLEEVSKCRWVHFGLTSSDVVDTGFNMALRASLRKILRYMSRYIESLEKLSKLDYPMMGRSHGIFGEETNFGYVMKGHKEEAIRNFERIEHCIKEISFGMFSGAMGNYAHLPPNIESKICQALGLNPEPVSTQVIPRDRYAFVFANLAIIAAGIERLALNIRLLSRSEVMEVSEGFSKGQKGSSAMPHKRNPITCENICGLSRMMRSYVNPSIENISLWHERDISHSSVERHIAPDSFNMLAYMLDKMTSVLTNLEIRPDRMQKNVESTLNIHKSEIYLLDLIKKGSNRKQAYEFIQNAVQECIKLNINLDQYMLQSLTTFSTSTNSS